MVGAPTPAKAMVRYRELQSKYAAILAGHETTHVVIRGVIGEMGAARVRVDAETRADATKLCADLRSAGWFMHGIQAWVALPEADEECAPGFAHHDAAALPEFADAGVQGRLIAGDRKSVV